MEFDLEAINSLSEDMPQEFVLLSDSTRLILLECLAYVKRWHWWYNGDKLDDDQWDEVEALLDLAHKEVLEKMLTGMIAPYGGSLVPLGWLLCDGSEVSREEYQDLFEVIGSSFGDGDGETTFNLPNLQDMFPVGLSGETSIGDIGGEAEVILSEAQMPHHHHTYSAAYPALLATGEVPNILATVKTGQLTGSAGDSLAHNNLPPYLVLSFIIKA